MQYVIFSDIHGNVYALRSLLAREGCSPEKVFIFCGDICGYYYHAEECIDLLETINGLITVRGNHDQYYLNAYNDYGLSEKLVRKYGSSYCNKIPKIYSYIKKMPERAELKIGDKRVYIQHGSYSDPFEGRVYPDTMLDNLDDNAVYIAGHTHYRMLACENDAIWINPGSLGQPRDGNGFSYCVLDDSYNVSFCKVEIDISHLIQEVRLNDPENKYLQEVLYRSI